MRFSGRPLSASIITIFYGFAGLCHECLVAVPHFWLPLPRMSLDKALLWRQHYVVDVMLLPPARRQSSGQSSGTCHTCTILAKIVWFWLHFCINDAWSALHFCSDSWHLPDWFIGLFHLRSVPWLLTTAPSGGLNPVPEYRFQVPALII